ncbi:MAG: MATE family efflux transporter [Algicola sp.]|nr:MATE family efflux transporter [Algicola sp.]
MILSNITVPLLGLVDTAVVGHLSEAYYLGGVAIGSMIITFIYSLAGFLRMATTGVTAQAYGKGSAELQLKALLHGVVIASVLSLLILLLKSPIESLAFMFAGGSEQVQYYGQVYFSIRIFSTPAALLNLVLLGWMLGMQTAKGPMWHLIFTNLINIVLDVAFVFGFGWGVEGVAAASVIADYCGVFIGVYFVRMIAKDRGIEIVPDALRFWQHWDEIKPLLLINRDILLRTFCLSLCFAFMTFEGARLGDNIVAANAILLNLLMLIAFGLDGIAYAVEALVGKAAGKNNRAELIKSIKDATFWSVMFAIAFTVAFLGFGMEIIRLLSNIEQVVQTAANYLPWLIAMPLVSMWCFLFDGIFIGLTRAKDMRDSTFFATFVGFFLVWWLTQDWGNHALWLAMLSFMLFRGVTLGLRFRFLLKRGLVLGSS